MRAPRCTRCNKFAKTAQTEVIDSKVIHVRGTGCRKDEPLLTINSAPKAPTVLVPLRSGGTARHVGNIGALAIADALINAGVVRVVARQ